MCAQTLLKNGKVGAAPALPLSIPKAGSTVVQCQVRCVSTYMHMYLLTCKASWQMFRDTDNDAGDPANEGVWASSVADCAAVCVASANCSYASYQSSVGTCWLKGNGAGRQHSAGIAFLDCSKAKPRPASKSVLMVGQQSADGFLLLGNYVDEG